MFICVCTLVGREHTVRYQYRCVGKLVTNFSTVVRLDVMFSYETCLCWLIGGAGQLLLYTLLLQCTVFCVCSNVGRGIRKNLDDV